MLHSFFFGTVENIGLPPMDLDEVEMHPETKKEQEFARLQSMYRSLKNGKVKRAKMPKAFDLEVYVYFGPSMIKCIGSESKAASMTQEMAAQAKKWLADPSIGARINVIATIKKIDKDTIQLNEWREMVPKGNHKKGRLHALIVANTTVGSHGKGASAGIAYLGSVCGKNYFEMTQYFADIVLPFSRETLLQNIQLPPDMGLQIFFFNLIFDLKSFDWVL